MKILNLYAGIGGNRKNWGDEHEITAVEYKQEIADIYHDFFPRDTIVVADAHQYLLEHYGEFDFIWSSPPCPSHSRIRNEAGIGGHGYAPLYPDMKLYEEIILLRHLSKMELFKGQYCIENVIPYYPPLIAAQELNLHLFWTNFSNTPITRTTRNHYGNQKTLGQLKGFDLSKYKGLNKIKILRNCVEPETGKHILDCAINSPSLFPDVGLGAKPQQKLI